MSLTASTKMIVTRAFEVLLLLLLAACLSNAESTSHHRDDGMAIRAARIASAQLNAGEIYRFRLEDGNTARAGNARHSLSATLDDSGLTLEPRGGGAAWSLALRWTGAGRAGEVKSVPTPLYLTTDGNRASYHRADGSEEWYLNGPLGIEQGFEIAERPAGNGSLLLLMETQGTLSPRLADDGEQILFTGPGGQLRYTDLLVTDAGGAVLNASFAVTGESVTIRIDDRAARYPLSVDPLLWIDATEDKKLVASDALKDANFGKSVSLSGDVAIVSNAIDGAYVILRDHGGIDNWGELKKLVPGDVQAPYSFGFSVCVSGDMAVVGAIGDLTGGSNAGAAYLFSRNSGGVDNWGQVKKLIANDAQPNDLFGWSVAVSGDSVVVGAIQAGATDTGAAYVFSRNLGGTDNWGQVKKLAASNPQENALFGVSVSVDGNFAVVGASGGDAAYVFSRNLGGTDNWGQVKQLTPIDGLGGGGFGRSASLSGDMVIVGAPAAGPLSSGAAYLYSRNQGGADNWGGVQRIHASDAQGNGPFGWSVSLSGDVAVVGDYFADTSKPGAGAAYLYRRNDGWLPPWREIKKLAASDANVFDVFGESVAVDGGTVIVGARFAENDFQGAAYVFQAKETNGQPCSSATTCVSGYCVDGVCCNKACGGSNTNDCVACSVSAGASADGACEVLPNSTECNDGAPSGNACDDPTSATLIGGAGNDYLLGTEGDDIIFGLGGDDILMGKGGHDILCGGAGQDVIVGGPGDDFMDGGAGYNWLHGNQGDDVIQGGNDGNELQGGAGNDTLLGGNGNDWMLGGDGDDVMAGGAGDDDMAGDAGYDVLAGDDGEDWLVGGEGNDCLDGGAADDRLNGEGGDDCLSGGAGIDQLACGDGNDSYSGGEWDFGGCETASSCLCSVPVCITDAQCSAGTFCDTSTHNCQKAEISSRHLHGCVRKGGNVQCWGYNASGELGNGETYTSNVPVDVIGLANAGHISTGASHTCALLSDGSAQCWGSNNAGALGNGSLVDSLAPVAVSGLSNATDISLGNSYTCAILTGGSVQCWGSNTEGQLGVGDSVINSIVPLTVPGLSNVAALATYTHHACALLNDGSIQCWGANQFGQLGNGQQTQSSVPVAVAGLTNVTAVSTGEFHSCALLADGTAQCWGMNSFGQLGNGDYQDTGAPTAVAGLSGATAISCGAWHTCAILDDGTARCWGRNLYGQLGNGANINNNTPVQVFGLSSAVSISAGSHHTCALTSSAAAQCWGFNGNGQLGNGTYGSSNVPVSVSGT